MSITSYQELTGMQEVGEVVGNTLRKMREYARPGMSTLELDEYGEQVLRASGASSAPKLTYNFPGYTCISLNEEIAHGVPAPHKILKEGDLVNIDVSAELDGYWADNGGSFVLGRDLYHRQDLVNTSQYILQAAIRRIRGGVRIAEIGRYIENKAKQAGYRVIKNLVGHGVGRSLHEEPREIPCYYDRSNTRRFKKNTVVAIETFISTRASYAYQKADGWTLVARDGSLVAQHEHTIVITDQAPLILTQANGI